MIEDPLTEEILRGTFKGKDTITVTLDDDDDGKKLKFEPSVKATASPSPSAARAKARPSRAEPIRASIEFFFEGEWGPLPHSPFLHLPNQARNTHSGMGLSFANCEV